MANCWGNTEGSAVADIKKSPDKISGIREGGILDWSFLTVMWLTLIAKGNWSVTLFHLHDFIERLEINIGLSFDWFSIDEEYGIEAWLIIGRFEFRILVRT